MGGFLFLTRSTLSSRTRIINSNFVYFSILSCNRYNKSPLRQSCKVNHFSLKLFPFPLFLYVQSQQRNREVCVCMCVVNPHGVEKRDVKPDVHIKLAPQLLFLLLLLFFVVCSIVSHDIANFLKLCVSTYLLED